MAELTPIPAAQRPADQEYQPLSGYAVAAVIVGGAFALALVVLVAIGLLSRRTPLSYELLVLPLAGVALAAVARSHIRASEGTRTGLKLANAAWWVCVLGGAGFAAFLTANWVVLRAESRRTADALLEALRNQRMQEAFVQYVLPMELRGRAEPGSPEFEAVYAPAGYSAFVSNDAVRLFAMNGSDVTFEHRSALDIGQEGIGFKATHVYRVTAPEGGFDVLIKMVASESRAGGNLQWHVQSGGPGVGITVSSREFSTYGRLVGDLVQDAERAARVWMSHLADGRRGLAVLATRPTTEQRSETARIAGTAMLAGPAAWLAPLGPEAGGPGTFDALLQSGFFRQDESGAPLSDARASKLRELWKTPVISPPSPVTAGPDTVPEKPTFTVSPDAVTVTFPAQIALSSPMDAARVTVGLTCTDPEVVAAVNAARAAGAASRDDGSVTVRALRPNWRIAWLQTTVEAIPRPRPDTPPGRGMPR